MDRAVPSTLPLVYLICGVTVLCDFLDQCHPNKRIFYINVVNPYKLIHGPTSLKLSYCVCVYVGSSRSSVPSSTFQCTRQHVPVFPVACSSVPGTTFRCTSSTFQCTQQHVSVYLVPRSGVPVARSSVPSSKFYADNISWLDSCQDNITFSRNFHKV